MEALRKLIKQMIQLQVVQATVTEVNGDVCTVLTDDGSKELFKVSLNAVRNNGADKLICYPKVGSSVAVGIYEGAREAVILSYSDVEKVLYKKETTLFEVDKDGFKIEREGENMGKVIDDFMNECKQIVVIYGNTINKANVESQRNRLKKILKQ